MHLSCQSLTGRPLLLRRLRLQLATGRCVAHAGGAAPPHAGCKHPGAAWSNQHWTCNRSVNPATGRRALLGRPHLSAPPLHLRSPPSPALIALLAGSAADSAHAPSFGQAPAANSCRGARCAAPRPLQPVWECAETPRRFGSHGAAQPGPAPPPLQRRRHRRHQPSAAAAPPTACRRTPQQPLTCVV